MSRSTRGLGSVKRQKSAEGKGLGLLVRPADLLLEAPQLRLDLGRDGDGRCLVMGDEVDDTACGPMDRDLEHSRPAWVHDADKGLGDPCLDGVAQARPGAGVETQICGAPECCRDRDEDREAGLAESTFDEGQEGVIDACPRGELALRESRIESQSPDLAPYGDPHLAAGAPRRRSFRPAGSRDLTGRGHGATIGERPSPRLYWASRAFRPTGDPRSTIRTVVGLLGGRAGSSC